MVTQRQNHVLELLNSSIRVNPVSPGRFDLIAGLVLTLLLDGHGSLQDSVLVDNFLMVLSKTLKGHLKSVVILLQALDFLRLLLDNLIWIW